MKLFFQKLSLESIDYFYTEFQGYKTLLAGRIYILLFISPHCNGFGSVSISVKNSYNLTGNSNTHTNAFRLHLTEGLP